MTEVRGSWIAGSFNISNLDAPTIGLAITRNFDFDFAGPEFEFMSARAFCRFRLSSANFNSEQIGE